MSDTRGGAVTLNLSAEEADELTKQLAGDVEDLRGVGDKECAEILSTIEKKVYRSQQR